ncbi:MAG TPA: hypothetical protein EYP59_11715 [Thiotrichaceae bacterium]|nr:hypothetical protein [Thiotrichaceae bacterium]
MLSENQANPKEVGKNDRSAPQESVSATDANNPNPLEHDTDTAKWSASEGYQKRYSASYRERYLGLEELLEFAAETGKLDPPELATEVKQLKKVLFYTDPDTLNLDELCKAEANLERLYATLSDLVAPVTLLTLRTTSQNYQVERPWWKALFLGSGSVGRNFFRKLAWIALILVSFIFFREYIKLATELDLGEKFLHFVDPFLYGALGALVYLYKGLTEDYINRTLNPKKLSTNWLRIFMGSLSGGIIVHLFAEFIDIKDIISNTGASNDAALMALGFLAGYSVEFFYQVLDKLIRVITPKAGGGVEGQGAVPASPKQAQIEMLTNRLKEMDNEEDKVAIRKLLDKI